MGEYGIRLSGWFGGQASGGAVVGSEGIVITAVSGVTVGHGVVVGAGWDVTVVGAN